MPNTCCVVRSSEICNLGSALLLFESSRSKRPSSGSLLALAEKLTSKLRFATLTPALVAGARNSAVAQNRATTANRTASLVRGSLFMDAFPLGLQDYTIAEFTGYLKE